MQDEKLIGHTYTEREFIEAANTRIRYRQEVHIKNFYIMLHDLFIHEGWVKREDSDWPENYYLLRENPTMGNEMWIWWRFKKFPHAPETGMTGFYRFNLDVFWHLTSMKDIEVMKQGNKFKTNNVDIELVFRSRVEIDYMHEKKKGWRDHSLLKHIYPFFKQRIFKTTIEKRRDELYRETYRIMEVCKNFLNMRSYMPITEGQNFWPTYGSGDKEGLLPNQ
jgi:hypothetical protein